MNCYAERMSKRLKAMGQERYRNGFKLTLHHDLLKKTLARRKPRTIFVNSMSDLFHEEIPFSFIQVIFDVMSEAKWHIFQILTKRSGILKKFTPRLTWPENVWMGVTVETSANLHRVDDLKTVPAAVRFISMEPLLERINNIDLTGMDWVIAGGESGPGARELNPSWVREVRDTCLKENIPFFFKQWGGFNKKKEEKKDR